MIAPHLAVQSIMTALQMNDYPEEDAGARTAYLFSKPHDCENLIAGQVCICCLCRDPMLFSTHFRMMWCLARWACRAGWLCVSIDNLSRACMNAVFLLSILEGHNLQARLSSIWLPTKEGDIQDEKEDVQHPSRVWLQVLAYMMIDMKIILPFLYMAMLQHILTCLKCRAHLQVWEVGQHMRFGWNRRTSLTCFMRSLTMFSLTAMIGRWAFCVLHRGLGRSKVS